MKCSLLNELLSLLWIDDAPVLYVEPNYEGGFKEFCPQQSMCMGCSPFPAFYVL